MDETRRKWFSAYVSDSFRDTADKDYVAARILNRCGLFQASSWSALQAVEKYLKGVLLFSHQSVRPYRSHNLEELFAAAKRLPGLSFTIPDESIEFMQYVNSQGANRYADCPVYVGGLELFKLDRLVWHLRRYCQDFLLLPGDSQRYPGESEKRLASIPAGATSATLKTFAIVRGYLEGVLRDKKSPLRPYLVWKNFYYGIKRKTCIRYTRTFAIQRPAHVMRPELLATIEPLVFFPKPVLEELRNLRPKPVTRPN